MASTAALTDAGSQVLPTSASPPTFGKGRRVAQVSHGDACHCHPPVLFRQGHGGGGSCIVADLALLLFISVAAAQGCKRNPRQDLVVRSRRLIGAAVERPRCHIPRTPRTRQRERRIQTLHEFGHVIARITFRHIPPHRAHIAHLRIGYLQRCRAQDRRGGGKPVMPDQFGLRHHRADGHAAPATVMPRNSAMSCRSTR